MVVFSRFTLCKTRLRSVRYSKDLMIRNVRVAEVFGRATFVKIFDIPVGSIRFKGDRPSRISDYQWAVNTSSRLLLVSSQIPLYYMSVAVYENGVSGTITTSPTEGIMSRQDPRTLTNLNEILSCLSSFQSEEAELSNSLTELLSAREPIVASLSRLQSLVPHLDELHLEASMLLEKVSSTAQTADRVGGKVRSLDEEMRRVRESAERVGQVMELKVIAPPFAKHRLMPLPTWFSQL